jgi:hypothetical protein
MVTGNLVTATLTITAGGPVAMQFNTDVAGPVVPLMGVLNVLGGIGGNITTTGGGNTVTFAVSGTTQFAVQVGNILGSLSSLAVGATGEGLMGTTGANPAWTNSPTFGGSVTATVDLSTLNGSVNAGDSSATAAPPYINFRKSRVFVVINSGDGLGNLNFSGHDGVGYTNGARITSTNSGTIGVNRIAGDLKFYTHPDVAGADILRMSISPAGEVNIAAPDAGAGAALTITNNGLTVTAGATTLTPLAALTEGLVVKSVFGVLGAIEHPAVDGQLLISSAAGAPVWANLTQGTGIVITNAANAITLDVSGGGLTWSGEAGAAVALVVNHGYINQNALLTTFTLPVAAALGTMIAICGEGAAGWTIAQNAGQAIQFGNTITTAGVGGSLSSSNRYDTVTLLCRVANTTWSVMSNVGVLNVV